MSRNEMTILEIHRLQDNIGKTFKDTSEISYRLYTEVEKVLGFKKSKPVMNPGIYSLEEDGRHYVFRQKTLILPKKIEKGSGVDLTDKIATFLSKENIIRDLGVDLVKMGVLLHGKPGCGKTLSINSTVNQLLGVDGLAIYVSSNIRPDILISLLNDYEIDSSVKKIFFIMEDLGGGESPDLNQRFIASDTALLGFLDGNDLPSNVHHLPIVMFATTNYPKLFLPNLTNRPGRFDEVIEVTLPSPNFMISYAEGLLNRSLSDFEKKELSGGDLSVAHIKYAVIKFVVYDIPLHTSLSEMRVWTKTIEKRMEKAGQTDEN